MNKWFDGLSKVVRVILLIPIWGWLVSGLYRIFKYVEGNKNVVTLVVGILCIIPVVGFVAAIVDIVTTLTEDKITVLAD